MAPRFGAPRFGHPNFGHAAWRGHPYRSFLSARLGEDHALVDQLRERYDLKNESFSKGVGK
jgi:hypothetical protein